MSKKTSFYLLTDAHLLSHRIWEEGKPINMRERGDQIALKATPEILDSFLEIVLADEGTDTVIFTGDNVNGGDMESHADFRARLEKLKAAGKNVCVISATHDYCSGGDDECFQKDAVRYTATGTEQVPFMRKGELFDYYYDYGPAQAVSVDSESGSYTVRLCEGVRLIMIVDNGNGRSHCGLFAEGVRWLTDQIREAKAAGDYVLLAVHHPVLPPWEVFRHMAEYELYGGYRDLWKLMCEENVRVVFTGHTHVQSIRKYEDAEGRYFYDVATIALANAAGKMRKVTVDAETGVCEVKSIGIETIAGVDTGGKSAYDYLYGLNFPGILEKLLPLGKEDFSAFLALAEGLLPVDKLKNHKLLVGLACKKLQNIRLSSAAKLGKAWKAMSPGQKAEAKSKKLMDAVFEVLRHIYPGNAPFTPDTVEYQALNGVAKRADRLVNRLKIEKIKSLIPPGSSLAEMAQDFLYNNRTGSDDEITIQL